MPPEGYYEKRYGFDPASIDGDYAVEITMQGCEILEIKVIKPSAEIINFQEYKKNREQ